jgi:hypothetical protein
MTPTISTGHHVDLQVLLETRLLVQANSGGGKSWLLRRVLEQTAPLVQQLIIDPEGEFSTLREKFDYVIAAPHDGDALATPQTAALLARRLLESGVSAILDIYDLKAHERILFVRRFLEALVNAPKALWRPVLIALDEAHVYAPQVGSAESLQAVSDIATRGRKRGQCLLAATQRLSKLHKDVAAELGNKMIGRTGLDVDVKRAADELGLASREATDSLRNLAPGEFYIFGPALSRTVERVRVGDVLTSHPKAGNRMMQAPPAPSPKLRAQLSKLADLQKDAEQEARTVEELRTETAKLKRDLAAATKRAEQAGVPEADVQRRVREAVNAEALRQKNQFDLNLHKTVGDSSARKTLERVADLIRKELESITPASPASREARAAPQQHASPPRAASTPAPAASGAGLSLPQQRIVDVVARLELIAPNPNKLMVAAHAGVSPRSSGYANNLGALRSAGLIDYPSGGLVALTAAGREIAASAAPPTELELHESFLAILSNPQAAILRCAIDAYPNNVGKDELAERCGVSKLSSGFANNLGSLRTLGAITYPASGTIRAADFLFPESGNGK